MELTPRYPAGEGIAWNDGPASPYGCCAWLAEKASNCVSRQHTHYPWSDQSGLHPSFVALPSADLVNDIILYNCDVHGELQAVWKILCVFRLDGVEMAVLFGSMHVW